MSSILQLYTQLYLGGGIPKVIERLGKDFRNTPNYVGLFETQVPEYLEVPNTVQIGDAVPGGNKLSNWYRRYRGLRSLKRQKGISITISHTIWLHLLNVLSGGDDKKILLLHSSIKSSAAFSRMQRIALRSVLILAARKTFACVAVSEELEHELRRLPGIRAKVVHILNYFEIEEISEKSYGPLEPALDKVFDNYPVLVSAGRLAPQKNYSFLIELFGRLKQTQDYGQAKLAIMGIGPELGKLVAQARSLDLKVTCMNEEGQGDPADADIIFLGHLANPYPVIRKASAYISTSLYEGFPIAVCEALVLQKLVIISDCPTGHIEIISGGARGQYELGWNTYGILLPLRGLSQSAALDHWFSFLRDHAHMMLNRRRPQLAFDRFSDNHKDEQLLKWKRVMGLMPKTAALPALVHSDAKEAEPA